MDDKKIILMAETGADIPNDEVEKYDIKIVPMHITFGEETKDDGSFPPEDICRYYEKTGTLPKTSGCVPEDFSRAFDEVHAAFPNAQILYLAYSAVTTCSYQSAQIAARGRNYITSLDTKKASAGQRCIVVTMSKLLRAHPEWSMDEAVKAANDLINRAQMCFVPDDLDYLRAGGRLSNATAVIGRILGIHPLIEFVDGKLVATKKLRGRISYLAPKLVRDYSAQNNLEKENLWLIRSPGFPDEICAEAEKAAKECGFKNLIWNRTGGVITTHGGPRAFGVVGFSSK